MGCGGGEMNEHRTNRTAINEREMQNNDPVGECIKVRMIIILIC